MELKLQLLCTNLVNIYTSIGKYVVVSAITSAAEPIKYDTLKILLCNPAKQSPNLNRYNFFSNI